MDLINALLEVLKDSPGNASLRKCDIERAKALLEKPAPAPEPAAEEKKDA